MKLTRITKGLPRCPDCKKYSLEVIGRDIGTDSQDYFIFMCGTCLAKFKVSEKEL